MSQKKYPIENYPQQPYPQFYQGYQQEQQPQQQQQQPQQAPVFTVYQLPYQPPNANSLPPRRTTGRVCCVCCSIFCAIASVVMLIVGIVALVALFNVIEAANNGVDYDSLGDYEPADWRYNVTECGKPFFAPSLLPDNIYPTSAAAAKSDDRIIHGTEANAHSFPWVVSLREIRSGRIMEHFCAGTIISEDTIVTAAHCVNSNDIARWNIRVVTALHERTADIEYKSQVYSVVRITQQFNPMFIYEKDLALLQLDRKIVTGKRVAPICLTEAAASSAQSSFTNRRMLTVGWGDTSDSYATRLATRLQQTMRRAVDDQPTCTYSFSITWRRDSVLCTTPEYVYDDDSVCMGDSGGPLMSYSTFTNKWYIEGITSYVIVINDNKSGNKKCDVTKPNFFTMVASFKSYILQNI